MANRKPGQNWDDLRCFLVVARSGTLSAAAEQLCTEHTTVARHIHALEYELESRLFHKSNSGYALTDAGERLLARGGRERLRFRQGGREQRRTDHRRHGSHRRTRWVWECLPGATRVRPHRPASPAQNRDLSQLRLFSLLKREADIAIGLSSPEQMRVVSRRLTGSPAVRLRLRGVSERSGADRCRGRSQTAPLHRLCRRAIVRTSAQLSRSDRRRCGTPHPEHERAGATPRHSVRKRSLHAARFRRIQLPNARSGAARASVADALSSPAHSRRS